MALSFGWTAGDVREGIWSLDPALKDVPAQALDAWGDDGDAAHLRPYALNGEPTIIRFRNLTCDEECIAKSYFALQDATPSEAYNRAALICFRIGVDFDGAPDEVQTPDGSKHKRIVRERGVRMLAEPFVANVKHAFPGLVEFYGGLIFRATYATELEKKASSPPVTPMPSSEAASMTATMEPSPAPGAA